MKRIICTLLAICMLLSLAACSGKAEVGTPTAAGGESEYENPDDGVAPGPTAEEEPEPQPLTMDTMAMTEFSFYSDGVAWASYMDENGVEHTCAVDEDGNILFTLEETPYFKSDFENGVAFCRIGDFRSLGGQENYYTCYEVILDKQGNELYRTEHDEENNTWEHILGYDDGLFLMASYTSGMTAAEGYLSVMNTSLETVSGPVSRSRISKSKASGKVWAITVLGMLSRGLL